MASRINIGPENGPYVAINESSGNLQLEENSGNVVAEWDETNAQWDFANNTLANVDALNSNSVNTEELGRGEGSLIEQASSLGSPPIISEPRTDPDDFSSTSSQRITSSSAGHQPKFWLLGESPRLRVPDGVTVYGFFFGRVSEMADEEEATFSIRYTIQRADSSSFNSSFDSLETTVTEPGEFESGWQELTDLNSSRPKMRSWWIRARTENGTTVQPNERDAWGLSLDWRVD